PPAPADNKESEADRRPQRWAGDIPSPRRAPSPPTPRRGGPGKPAATPARDSGDAIGYRAGKLPPNLPAWFTDADTHGDGQVSLFEWKERGGSLEDFRKKDLNGDGFITVEELILAGEVVLAKKTGPAPPPTPTEKPKEKPATIPDPGNMTVHRLSI